MHTYKSDNGTIFNFNSDFSGEVIITNSKKESIEVNGDDILEFVSEEFIKQKIISSIEQMSILDSLNVIHSYTSGKSNNVSIMEKQLNSCIRKIEELENEIKNMKNKRPDKPQFGTEEY